MCMAIPMQVLRMEGPVAVCRSRNGIERVDTLLTGPVPVGGWVLGFLGSAREIVDAERALAVDRALDALAAVQSGGPAARAAIDDAFADLIGREPQWPAVLRRPT